MATSSSTHQLHSSASTMQRRPEFSFPGSPLNARPREEEVRWLQASRQGSPDSYYYNNNSSGTPSPQLWAHHQHQNRAYPGGSPPSRAHVIAGYRREMLDLVRGLPESAYELSLRDIVEHHHPSSSPSSFAQLPAPPSSSNTATAREPAADDPAAEQSGAATSRKQGRKKQRSRSLERSVSLDTGLLIKFFLPLSIGGRGGKKKKGSSKPVAAKDSKKKQGTKKKEEARQKRQDEEWWTKSEFSEEASGSSSRTSSTGSSNSNSSTGSVRNGGGSNPRPPVRSRSRKINGCYAFFRRNKTKNGVGQD